MLSLTKRSEAQPVAAPLWHPNFRNFDRLPDTKVVRTTFFINTAAIAAALGLLLWLGYRQFHIHTLAEQISDAQAQIDANTKQNNEALRQTGKFADESKKLAEAAQFVKAPIPLSEYIDLLGTSLPKEISIEFADARFSETTGGTFTLRGLVAGTPDQASGTASSYVDMLRAHPRLGKVFNPITLTNLNRDAATGFLAFSIVLKVSPEAKGK